MLKLIFDTNALITSCKFHVRELPVIKYIAEKCEIVISHSVNKEIIIAEGRYSNAVVAKELIRDGKINVKRVLFRDYDVLDHYRLGKGEKESIALAIKMVAEVDFTITDDRLAYIVIDRMDIKKLLFLDLIVELVERGLMNLELAKSIINAIKSRYPEGFVYHTLKILDRGDRKCLK